MIFVSPIHILICRRSLTPFLYYHPPHPSIFSLVCLYRFSNVQALSILSLFSACDMKHLFLFLFITGCFFLAGRADLSYFRRVSPSAVRF